MTHRPSPVVGWTDARVRRAKLFAVLVAAAAAVALWAMTQPWVAVTLNGAAPTCVQPAGASSTQVLTPSGQTQTISVSGCITGYQSVHQDDFLRDLGVNPALVAADEMSVGAPEPGATFGIPSATFWLLVMAALAVAGCVVRNGALFVAGLFPMKWSYAAFAAHRAALVWGLDPAPYAEMPGIAWHSYAYVFVAGMSVVGALFVMKINFEQRKLDFAAFQRGEQDRPAGLTTIHLIAKTLLRAQADKVGDLYDKAVEDARPGAQTAAGDTARPPAQRARNRVLAGTGARR